jgi:hypothetical protein
MFGAIRLHDARPPGVASEFIFSAAGVELPEKASRGKHHEVRRAGSLFVFTTCGKKIKQDEKGGHKCGRADRVDV